MNDVTFVAVDWGTTSFRLWVLNACGEILDERRGNNGMSTLKPDEFEPLLEGILTDLGVENDVPVIICGMAGAAQGWQEVSYLDLPAKLNVIPMNAKRIANSGRDIRILPGLAQRAGGRPDVIRGEETLLMGAVLAEKITGTICLPGTHSKWAFIAGGEVTEFATAMTGEVFGLLSQKSTLSHFITVAGNTCKDSQAFEDAVLEGFKAPEKILQKLFSVRSTPLLLGQATIPDMPARLSGLLIGLELAGVREQLDTGVTLISGGVLAENYSRAFKVCGVNYSVLSADDMVRAGLFQAAQTIWPQLANAQAIA